MVAAVLSLGLAAPAVADDRPPKVTPKDLPFTAAVAEIYPALEGGSRYVTKQAKSVLLRSTEDCVATEQVERADRGTRADFFLAGDLDPLEQGVDDPTIAGYRFPYPDSAVFLLEQVRDYADTCAGEHTDEEDRTVTLTRLEDPDLGDEAVALLVEVTFPGGGYHQVDVLVRDLDSVARVQVKRADGPPDLDAALTLATVAVERLVPSNG